MNNETSLTFPVQFLSEIISTLTMYKRIFKCAYIYIYIYIKIH